MHAHARTPPLLTYQTSPPINKTNSQGVAERGPWVSNLANAYDKHKRGDSLGALLLYAHMAEMGYEVAQANAAVLLEEVRLVCWLF